MLNATIVLVKMVARRKIVALCVMAIVVKKKQERKKRHSRKVWVKKWLKSREQIGAYNQLMKELSLDVSSYCNFLRMNASTFEELMGKVALLSHIKIPEAVRAAAISLFAFGRASLFLYFVKVVLYRQGLF